MEDFPMKIYFFNEDGMYDKHNVFEVQDKIALSLKQPAIMEHIRAKLEVRITDPQDYCLFHAKDGKIIFPKVN